MAHDTVPPPETPTEGVRSPAGQRGAGPRSAASCPQLCPCPPADSTAAPSPTPPPRPPRSSGCAGLSAGGLAPLTAAPSADPQHVRRVHGAPGHLAAGQQRQGHARLVVRLQPPAGRDHTVRPPAARPVCGSPRPPGSTVGRREGTSASGPPGPGWLSLAPGGKPFKGGCGGGGLLPPSPRGKRQRVRLPGSQGGRGVPVMPLMPACRRARPSDRRSCRPRRSKLSRRRSAQMRV